MKNTRIAFLGSKPLGLALLKELALINKSIDWLVLHPDDLADDRSSFAKIRDFCARYDLPFKLVKSQIEADALLVEFRADIAIVSGWYWILSRDSLALVETGFYGLHPSLLPKFRGGSPLPWSIISGESKIGFSIFKLSEGMDDGDIYTQVPKTLEPHENIADALLWIQDGAVAAFRELLPKLIGKNAIGWKQEERNATYCALRRPDDGKIDWTQSAQSVHDFIRAQAPPYPGAFTYIRGEKVIFLKTEVRREPTYAIPGQVLRYNNCQICVSCGDFTSLRVLEIAVNNEVVHPRKVFKSAALRL